MADPAGQKEDNGQKTGDGARVGGSVSTGGGDFIGRDKIIQNISNVYKQAVSGVEEAEKSRSIVAQRLAEGVRDYTERLGVSAQSPEPAGPQNPYRGLQSYRLQDAERFHGREGAIDRLMGALEQSGLTILHAESGAGKSSLLHAGIAPRLLVAGHFYAVIRPYNLSPSLKIKRTFLPSVADIPELAGIPLQDFLHRVTGVLGKSTRLHLFLDQFEEFFNFLSEDARGEFVNDLADCLEDPGLNVKWLLALRSEYFSDLASFRPCIRNPFGNDFRLNRLNREEARQVISGPAQGQGVEIEGALVKTILEDLQSEKGAIAPPQLQLICSALFELLLETGPGGTQITHAMYTDEGGAQGILGDYLSQVLRRMLSKSERAIARRVFVGLVSSEQQRVRRTLGEICEGLGEEGEDAQGLKALLEILITSRLVNVIDDEEIDEPVYELAHDYLLGEVELTPEMKERKEAQESLEIGVAAYRRFATLLGPQELEMVQRHRAHLVIDKAAQVLLARSQEAVFPKPGINIARIDLASEVGKRTAKRVERLRVGLGKTIPSREQEDLLLVATWNLRRFGRLGEKGRLDESLHYIAEIISHFDVVALQEVMWETDALLRVQELLGDYWEVVHSDVTVGPAGNNERFAFLYDSRKVQHDGNTGGLVIPPLTVSKGEREAVLQPIRTPYLAGFRVGEVRFTLINVHIIYGRGRADDPSRVQEIQSIGEVLNMRNRRVKCQILLGDFNTKDADGAALQGLMDAGFVIGDDLRLAPTSTFGARPYDQIAVLFGDDEEDRELEPGAGGVVNYYDTVFTEDDESLYAEVMGETYWKKTDSTRHYLRLWRTMQMSDHYPKWLALKLKGAGE